MNDQQPSPLDLGDEYVVDDEGRVMRDDTGDEWTQWARALRREITTNAVLRNAQADGDDLHRQIQNELTHATRVLFALEHNYDRLRAADGRVARARRAALGARARDNAFGARCNKARNWFGAAGVLGVIGCFALPSVPGGVVWVAVLGCLGGIGFGLLSVMGGRGGHDAAEAAETEWRDAETALDALRGMVERGEREPGQTPVQQSKTVDLFPAPRRDGSDRGSQGGSRPGSGSPWSGSSTTPRAGV